MKNYLFALSIAAMALTASASSCGKEDSSPKKTTYITDETKLEMLNSIKDLDGTGRLYEVNYMSDYKLDEVLASGVTDANQLFQYIAYLLYDVKPTKSPSVTFGAGCSTFAVPESGSLDFIMGRNYDYRHSTKDGYVPTSAILVHTAPKDGKKSISMVDGMNLNYGQGFYDDEDKDLSLLVGLPYAALDGINEDGFAIGVLAVNEEQTCQENNGPKIGTTVAIRMLLDRASTVREAVDMLGKYSMDMRGSGRSNYHYFMADATGDYAIVEYTYDGGEYPSKMEVFRDNDTLRCLTNFYVAPSMVGTNDGWGSNHGRARYDTIRNTLKAKNYTLSEDEAMTLLKNVSQPPTEELTSQTQWSSLYNLTQKTLRLAILREYGKEYEFRVE
ncbi:MAG: carcinine hydrolase/isopenicillin-N N-acyltransferase family protein [Candidatus Cryptobacteroides sp.]